MLETCLSCFGQGVRPYKADLSRKVNLAALYYYKPVSGIITYTTSTNPEKLCHIKQCICRACNGLGHVEANNNKDLIDYTSLFVFFSHYLAKHNPQSIWKPYRKLFKALELQYVYDGFHTRNDVVCLLEIFQVITKLIKKVKFYHRRAQKAEGKLHILEDTIAKQQATIKRLNALLNVAYGVNTPLRARAAKTGRNKHLSSFITEISKIRRDLKKVKI